MQEDFKGDAVEGPPSHRPKVRVCFEVRSGSSQGKATHAYLRNVGDLGKEVRGDHEKGQAQERRGTRRRRVLLCSP